MCMNVTRCIFLLVLIGNLPLSINSVVLKMSFQVLHKRSTIIDLELINSHYIVLPSKVGCLDTRLYLIGPLFFKHDSMSEQQVSLCSHQNKTAFLTLICL